jgi:hypothetical protein
MTTTNPDDTDHLAIGIAEMTASHDMSKLKKLTFERPQEHLWLPIHHTQLEQMN